MKGFRALAAAAAVTVYGQIVLGGVVRITGSGLACPDWPACQGHLIPDLSNSHVVIEYAHRLLGSAAGLLMVATAVYAVVLYLRRDDELVPLSRGLMVAAVTGVGLIVVQGVLGGVTVLMGNSPFTVAIHLGNALLVLAAALLVAIWAGRAATALKGLSKPDRVGPAFPRFLYGSLAAAFAIVISGAYVVGAGAGTACTGWPLCGAGGSAGADIHMLHRVVVLVAGLVILRTIHYAQRHWRGTPMAGAVYLAALAFVAEIGVGAAQVLAHLPEALRAAHVALATAVWAGVVLMAASYWLESRSDEPAALVPGTTLRRAEAR